MSVPAHPALRGVACLAALTALAALGAAGVATAKPAAKPDCVVPNVIDEGLGQAKAALRSHHCGVGAVSGAASSTAIVGTESPVAQSRHPYDTKVSLVLKVRPARTTTAVFSVYECTQNNTACYYTVSGGLFTGPTTQVVGQTLRYTVTDATTGKVLATFRGTSNIDASCTIAASDPSGTVTLTGSAEPPYAGCALGTIMFPDSDDVLLSSSFAGNARYAAATSGPTATF